MRPAQPAAAGGRVYQGDLFDPLPPSLRGSVDVLVAHAPYVPSDAIGLLPPDARLNEPRVSLDGGADGLDIVRRIVAAAPPGWPPAGTCCSRPATARRRRPSGSSPGTA